VRKGLKEILTNETQEVICGEATNAQEVLDEVERQSWDLVILDISMPGRSGLDVLKELRQRRRGLRVLVLSIHSEEQYGERALMAGAAGYLNKESVPDELVRAVRYVLAGRTYVSQAMAERLAAHLKQDTTGRPPHESLSDREFETLRLIGSGKSTAQIAAELHLSATTVSTYRARILAKMNMKTTAELIHYAVKNNLAV
jgi:DNA-binding NarL/FixJ family response regulator